MVAVKKKVAKAVSAKPNKEGVMYAALKDIEVERGFNVRSNTKPDPELVQSVKENGVIRPVHVRWKSRKKDKFYLIDGQRRYEAAGIAGLGSVPIVQHGSIGDKEALVISLSANENQKRLTRKEQYEGYRRLKAEGFTPVQIAKVMAVDRRTVDEALKIQEKGSKALKDAASKSVKQGGVPARVASRVAALPKTEQKKVLPKVKGKAKGEGLKEVRKAEKRIGITKPGPSAKALRDSVPKVGKSKFKFADDATERAAAMEKKLREKLRYSKDHRVLNGQMMVLEVLRGKMAVTDLFGWDGVKG